MVSRTISNITYLQPSRRQERLTKLAILAVERVFSEILDLEQIIDKFACIDHIILMKVVNKGIPDNENICSHNMMKVVAYQIPSQQLNPGLRWET